MTLDVRWTGHIDTLAPADRTELVARAEPIPALVRDKVDEIHARVQADKDQALIDYTRVFDGVSLDELVVPEQALEQAYAKADPAFLDAFELACDQVRTYHQALTTDTVHGTAKRGVHAYERRVPLARVGIYVPGGRAAYPSTVAMTVVPAQVAGVRSLTVASPPGPGGRPHPLVLAACHHLGVKDVVAVGGAQAIFALAYGTESVPACDAVVGPGNVYVQAAKERIAGPTRIDAPAGPSEVAVLAGPQADPAVAARELVAQAEHDPSTLAVAVCLGDGTSQAVLDALEHQLGDLERAEIVQEALAARGAVLTAATTEDAMAFIDELAPEHCVLLHPDGPAWADELSGPACIVTGENARVAITDYVAGPSHVLPTGGHARAHSGIDVDTFTKRVHVAVVDEPDPELLEAGARLARFEGLEGHARTMDEEADR